MSGLALKRQATPTFEGHVFLIFLTLKRCTPFDYLSLPIQVRDYYPILQGDLPLQGQRG